MRAKPWSHSDDSRIFELLWVHLNSAADHTLIGALYHPPKPKYQPSTLLDFIVASTSAIRRQFPSALVVLAGDFNRLPCTQIVAKCFLEQIVHEPTCGPRTLDKIYVSQPCYSTVKVVQPRINTDHKAVVAYSDDHWVNVMGYWLSGSLVGNPPDMDDVTVCSSNALEFNQSINQMQLINTNKSTPAKCI